MFFNQNIDTYFIVKDKNSIFCLVYDKVPFEMTTHLSANIVNN